MKSQQIILLVLVLFFGAAASLCGEEPVTENTYYTITRFAIPEGEVLEIGGIELLPDGKLAVCTRRGEIWMISNPFSKDPEKESKFTRFAHGLHETLGMAYRDGWLYVVQRPEVTRIKDTDGDGKADVFENVSDGWEISGDYHEYAFGSRFDKDGNLWVTLCLTGSFSSAVKYRGWCLRITPDGKAIPTTSGIRSPGGMGMNAAGDVFYTENQGPWNGACALKHLEPGKFVGHPAGLQWHSLPEVTASLGVKPTEPVSKSRMMVEAKKIPQLLPPAIYFPYPKMGQSASGIVCDTSGGKFGPFQNQLFVGDQSHSTVMRVVLEKVQGHYQGACIPFKSGFGSGNLGMLMTDAGSLFVGGTDRGWGARGGKPFALERLDWTGKVPFEVHEVRAKADGFEFTFTEPIDVATASDPKSYAVQTYTYIYQGDYGSPEVDQTKPTIDSIDVSADGKTVRLHINKLVEGHVHEMQLKGLKNAAGQHLLHSQVYYTLNYLPSN